jgi:predicted dehydrogenase
MRDILKVGVAGTRRGAELVEALRFIDETAVTAICGRNESALNDVADRFEIENRFAHYEDMIGSDIDVVVIATPENLHVPQAAQALDAGIHVLCEVTAATSLKQCDELVRAARRSSAKYMLAENYCYRKTSALVKSMVRQGVFGDVYFAEGDFVMDGKALYRDVEGTPTWRHQWQVGINRCNYVTHVLGPVLQWFGERAVSVCSLGTGAHTNPEHGMDDSVLMLCKTESDCLIKVRSDMLSNRPIGNYFSLQGTNGCYESPRGFGDQHKVWLTDYSKDSEEWLALSAFEEEFLPDSWRNAPKLALEAEVIEGDYLQLRDFVDSVIHDTAPPIDVYDALDFTLPGLVSEQSIANGGAPAAVPDPRTIK